MTKEIATAKLADIQHQLRAPKNKENTFGKYAYRNAEGIIAAFKSLSIDGACLTCTDTLQEVAGQVFVTATARLVIGGDIIEAQGHAMHPLEKKGMDASQITGSASSYARKYALCGLFAVEDESQDPDGMDNRQATQSKPKQPELNTNDIADAKAAMLAANTVEALGSAYQSLPKPLRTNDQVKDLVAARKLELTTSKPEDKPNDNADLGGDEIPM